MSNYPQYLQRPQIDTVKWDQCIDKAPNGLIYAYSFYLDHMAANWDALVLGDYEAVMPLTWNKKWGIAYLYQPPFTQQLGIFGSITLTQELVNTFLAAIPRRFALAELFLNYAHPLTGLPEHANFILRLQPSYNQLQTQYKHDLLKNLKRASRFNLEYSAEVDFLFVLQEYKRIYGHRTPHLTANNYDSFNRLCASLSEKERLVRCIKENGQLLSAAVLLQKNNRLYLLASVTWPEGRDREANHYLLDRLIYEFAESDRVIDFEGSDLPGVAHFYSNFGSINQPYFFYRYNRLPWLVRAVSGKK